MSKQTEALKRALEQTLEMLSDNREYIEANERAEYLAMYDKAIAGAEKALAEQPAPVQQEPVAGLSETQAKAILVLALDLEKTGRAVAIAEGQERTDFVNRNRNIQCALEDALRNATTPQAQPRGEATLAREPLTFEEWLAKQHGDPEEIGFLQALRIAYLAGQGSIGQEWTS